MKLEPCPNCGGEVEWTNSRDLLILTSYIICNKCNGRYFCVETIAFERLPNLDYETTAMKYNAWVKTKPKGYYSEGEWS